MSSVDHYENFPVASWLCPARLRPAIRALYRFARTADDLADEGHDPAHHRLDYLGEYRADLLRCFAEPYQPEGGWTSARWPHVFGPLQEVLQAHRLQSALFLDLLDAFEQDIVYTRVGQGYRDRAELLDYCRRSANPIGRLMLQLYGVNDPDSLAQSDAICTALQLINLWQDRAQDLQRGRDYLPHDHSLEGEIAFARALMEQGAPLVKRVKGRAGLELRVVVQGGLRMLDKLEARAHSQDHSTLVRPSLNKFDYLHIAWQCVRM